MSDSSKTHEVISYYDGVVQSKLGSYLYGNPRIEEAYKTIVKYRPASPNPLNILEVGCGVGDICHRMNRQWPQAQITGIDISPGSIDTAKKLFANDHTHFIAGILTEETFNESFDMIIFMDVYEHIAVEDRPVVHAAIKKLLKNKGRLILSVPTPHNLTWSAVHKPETMQPVDEHISLQVITRLALETGTEVLLYQIRDIWNVGDYAHVVFEKNDDFEAAFFHPKPVTFSYRVLRRSKRIWKRITGTFKAAKLKGKLK
ncbi:Methyltransferase domain-containing protein [bacterium A37T11]|nr:Methyltransferase domain-containing protein [bacterium A37T11]